MQNKKAFEKEKIIKYFCRKNFGETVTYKELQQFTHYNLNDDYENYKFKTSLMGTVKNELIEEKGYVLKSIRKVGYYILKPNQIQSYTYRTYITKPFKSYQKAEIILNKTKMNKLNEKQFQKHKLTQKLNKELIDITNNLINCETYKVLKD